MKQSLSYGAALSTLMWTLAVHAGASTPDPARVELGSQLYLQMCRQCHGPELQSSGAGSFDLRQFPPDDPQRFHQSVLHGKNGMPAHDDILTDDDIDALFAYVVATQRAQQARKP
ncbi:c-type cytochrome [Immundisolibacter sp.]